MARTVGEIYDELIALKTTIPELNDLSSTSTTAIWRLIYYVVAAGLSLNEQLWDLFKSDLEEIKSTMKPLTAKYWVDRLKNFYQYNIDPLKGELKLADDYTFYYDTVDEASQIIDYASVVEVQNQVFIKVAKDSSGTPVVLSTDELNSVKTFVAKYKYAGTLITVNSWAADSIKFDIDIYYTADFVESDVLQNIKNAINSYLGNLEFDGRIELIKVVDVIQLVNGVKNVVINSAFGIGEDEVQEIELNSSNGNSYNTKAGYATLDEVNSIFTMKLYV